MKRYVILPDIHVPYEDRKATQAVIDFIGEYQPDKVIQIGDLMDFPQPSRWSKDSAAEFQGSVFEDAEAAKRRFLAPLRRVYNGPVGVIEGNHDERPRVYLAKYAPALAESHAFNLDVLLDFNGFGVTLLPEVYEMAPGWVATHGHRAGVPRTNQEAGRTALNAATNKFHKSVVMGHTHRLAALPKTFGYAGEGHTLWGVEVGNLMNQKMAKYLKGATANWQQGFCVIHVNHDHVSPQIIPILDGRFVVDGISYRV